MLIGAPVHLISLWILHELSYRCLDLTIMPLSNKHWDFFKFFPQILIYVIFFFFAEDKLSHRQEENRTILSCLYLTVYVCHRYIDSIETISYAVTGSGPVTVYWTEKPAAEHRSPSCRSALWGQAEAQSLCRSINSTVWSQGKVSAT